MLMYSRRSRESRIWATPTAKTNSPIETAVMRRPYSPNRNTLATFAAAFARRATSLDVFVTVPAHEQFTVLGPALAGATRRPSGPVWTGGSPGAEAPGNDRAAPPGGRGPLAYARGSLPAGLHDRPCGLVAISASVSRKWMSMPPWRKEEFSIRRDCSGMVVEMGPTLNSRRARAMRVMHFSRSSAWTMSLPIMEVLN